MSLWEITPGESAGRTRVGDDNLKLRAFSDHGQIGSNWRNRNLLVADVLTCCRQNCNCQILKEPQIIIALNEQPATGTTSISHKPRISADFNRFLNLVRD